MFIFVEESLLISFSIRFYLSSFYSDIVDSQVSNAMYAFIFS